MLIVLDRLPLPPSDNELYPTIRGRRVTGKALKQFQRAMNDWGKANGVLLARARRHILAPGWCAMSLIRVDALHCISSERIYTLDGKRKQLDAANRCKALHDCLAKLLWVDDRHFYTGSSKPATVAHSSLECTTVTLKIERMRTRQEELREMLPLGSSCSPASSTRAP